MNTPCLHVAQTTPTVEKSAALQPAAASEFRRHLKLQNQWGFFKKTNLHSSGEILHYLCIFNRKFREKLAFRLQFTLPRRIPRRVTDRRNPFLYTENQ